MKSFSRWWVIAIFAALLVVVANLPAFADTYHSADFSGADLWRQPECQGSFRYGFAQGGPVSGHFVYDDNLIPAGRLRVCQCVFFKLPRYWAHSGCNGIHHQPGDNAPHLHLSRCYSAARAPSNTTTATSTGSSSMRISLSQSIAIHTVWTSKVVPGLLNF